MEIEFSKNKLIVLLLSVLILIYLYLRMGCSNLVSFSPASNYQFGNAETEHYYYYSKGFGKKNKFKTKSEGVSFCVNDKIGF